MKSVVFIPEARDEAAEAQKWYGEVAAGLGLEFARSVAATAAAIARFPESYEIARDRFRRAPLRRFPYSLFYEITDNEVVILRCFHHRKNPQQLDDLERAP